MPAKNTRTRRINWKALVAMHEDLNAPHTSYRFRRKTFKETDRDGIYNSAKPN